MNATMGRVSVTWQAPRHHKRLPLALVAAGLDDRSEDMIVARWYERERGDAIWRDGRTPDDQARIEAERSER